jgi:hypothetical protein
MEGVRWTHLVNAGVAASDVVLRYAVQLCDAREIIAHVLQGLQSDHLLKINEGLCGQASRTQR